MPKQVPVYLFTGFLESGKTKFAQETLQDSSFNNGDRMLLLVCEEGIEEYVPDEFAAPNIFMEVIKSEAELTTELQQQYAPAHGGQAAKLRAGSFESLPRGR